jgi:hypothetical protein
MVRPEGFEPPTLWFVAKCSIQLSYGRTLRGMQPFKDNGLWALEQAAKASLREKRVDSRAENLYQVVLPLENETRIVRDSLTRYQQHSANSLSPSPPKRESRPIISKNPRV